ncbi:unnamed protein product, partial [Symbiodinium microadriaticum]
DFISTEGPTEAVEPTQRPRSKGKGKGKEPEAGKGQARGKGFDAFVAAFNKGRGKGKGKSLEDGFGKGKGKAWKGNVEEGEKGKGAWKGKGKGKVPGQRQGVVQEVPIGERHVDVADGVPRSFQDMLQYYADRSTKMEILRHFQRCPPEESRAWTGDSCENREALSKIPDSLYLVITVMEMWPAPVRAAARFSGWLRGASQTVPDRRVTLAEPLRCGRLQRCTTPLVSLVGCYAAVKVNSGTRSAARKRRKGPTLKLLREKLKELGLPSSGKKAELLERLYLAVQEAADEEEVDVLPALKRNGSRGLGDVEDAEGSEPSSMGSAGPPTSDDPDVIRPGDEVYLRAHTGYFLDVENDRVQARWEDMGTWQSLVIEKSPLVVETTSPTEFRSGDLAFFRAHTGFYLDVQDEGSPVQARWQDLGVWQGLEMSIQNEGPLKVGDTVFLKTHTGLYVDVQGASVQARWADEGDWQALTIER